MIKTIRVKFEDNVLYAYLLCLRVTVENEETFLRRISAPHEADYAIRQLDWELCSETDNALFVTLESQQDDATRNAAFCDLYNRLEDL